MHKTDLRKKQLETLCKQLNISLNNLALLDQALTHTSFAHEAKTNPKPGDNERLEFLGDAVLSLSVSSYIYEQFAEMPEGEMTKLRARVVCEQALAKFARTIALGEYLLLGKGEESSGGRNRNSILSDAVEAVIGACYVDNGFAEAKKLALLLAQKEVDEAAFSDAIDDYKTKFQEVVQKEGSFVISYKLLAEEGPSHDKLFKMAVLVNGEQIATGEGYSKKEAEQMAAKKALQKKL